MKRKVFIDGAEGTTGLRLADRLAPRTDIELLKIDSALRKDTAERARIANQADIVFLCLPDAAAIEAVAGITNPDTRIIDASTAHRVADDWAYGLPELSQAHRDAIVASKRVSNPGCYAMGFVLSVYPLTAQGIVNPDYPFTCHGVSGYSGGGRSLIAQYENTERPDCYNWPRQYGLPQQHKHQPEMQKRSGLAHPPVFNPILCDLYAGMVVTVPLHLRLLNKKWTAQDVQKFFADYYAGQRAVKVMDFGAESACEAGMIDTGALANSDLLQLFVCGSAEQAVLVCRMDNLGKGASGAAIQSMNLMCGLDEMTGLNESF